MATKAELEAELAALRAELAQKDAPANDVGPPEEEADSWRGILKDHGFDPDDLGGAAQELMNELKTLQQDKPMLVLAAAFVLGVLLGRSSR